MKYNKKNKHTITILGAGSWGGTLAWLLSQKNYLIHLWTFSNQEWELLNKTKALIRPKRTKLNKNIHITTNLKETLNSDVIIIAVPTNAFKDLLLKLKQLNLSKKVILLSATKGITTTDYLRPSQILKKYLPQNKFAVLSGPNIALDVLSQTPIISVISSSNLKIAAYLQEIISSKYFRIYINNDVDGVEIAGALKNVIAIAAGISDGFGFNISTKAALISRGLIEISKIAIKEGASAKTLLGAAGIGDLIATCCSTNSRNYRVGYELAKGKKLSDVLKKLGQVAEGTETVKSMIRLAKKHNINTPIASAVYKIAVENKKPKIVLEELLNRPLAKHEIEF